MRLLCRLEPLDFLTAGESSGLVGPGKTDTHAPAVKKAKVQDPKRGMKCSRSGARGGNVDELGRMKNLDMFFG